MRMRNTVSGIFPQGTGEGFSWDWGQTLDTRVSALERFRQPANYQLLVPPESRVALFGTDHFMKEAKEHFIVNMDRFKQMGFTHLAMEGIFERRQPLIDTYFAEHPNASRNAVLRILKRDLVGDPLDSMRLIDAARANGLKVVGVDVKLESSPLDVKGIDSPRHTLREEHWAGVITRLTGDEPNSRVLLDSGRNHAKLTRPITTLLREANLNPTVFRVFGNRGRDLEEERFAEAVRAAGLAGEEFAVRDASALPSADYLVHLPTGTGA